MNHAEARHVQGWEAELDLTFARRDGATLLARNRHRGPLRVQKPLYPEGPATCHALLLHPPAGIAGGDRLDIRAGLGEGTGVLLTTPGAGKWYRSTGAPASQRVSLALGRGACVEWLPQENIVFDRAQGRMDLDLHLAPGARALGWDIVCLGRSASGERFDSGSLRQRLSIHRDGRLLFRERGLVEGGGRVAGGPAGWRGEPVSGLLWALGGDWSAETLAACRALPTGGLAAWGLTMPRGLLLARCLAPRAGAARDWFAALWGLLRPGLNGRRAETPRIWNT